MSDNSQETKENSEINNQFISVEKIKPDLRKKDPPLVDVKVANPVTYIKSWWKKVIGNEGMDIRIKIKPLTAILVTAIVVTLCLGITKLSLPFNIPFLEMNDEATSTPVSYRKTAFAGTLRFLKNSSEYYLEINSSEAIILEIPDNINLEKFIGRRIFATGEYNDNDRILKVSDVSDLEIFPEIIISIPTIKPTPTPSESPFPTISPTEYPLVSSEPVNSPSDTIDSF